MLLFLLLTVTNAHPPPPTCTPIFLTTTKSLLHANCPPPTHSISHPNLPLLLITTPATPPTLTLHISTHLPTPLHLLTPSHPHPIPITPACNSTTCLTPCLTAHALLIHKTSLIAIQTHCTPTTAIFTRATQLLPWLNHNNIPLTDPPTPPPSRLPCRTNHRITNATPTSPPPFLASIHSPLSGFRCTATLLTPTTLITSSRCASPFYTALIDGRTRDTGIRRRIKSVAEHPNRYGIVDNVAILTLRRRVRNATVIRVNVDAALPVQRSIVRLFSFGDEREGDSDGRLRSADMSVVKCAKGFDEALRCTRGDGCTTCRNDRGGAWVAYDGKGRAVLVGVQVGGDCYSEGGGVFVPAPAFVGWLEGRNVSFVKADGVESVFEEGENAEVEGADGEGEKKRGLRFTAVEWSIVGTSVVLLTFAIVYCLRPLLCHRCVESFEFDEDLGERIDPDAQIPRKEVWGLAKLFYGHSEELNQSSREASTL